VRCEQGGKWEYITLSNPYGQTNGYIKNKGKMFRIAGFKGTGATGHNHKVSTRALCGACRKRIM
jgi:hypothetical protein